MRVLKECPMCGEFHHIDLKGYEEDEYMYWLSGQKHIQVAFPHMLPCDREFLGTGYCPKCQEELFGNGKTERIVKGE